jgi:hypothetical protein
MIYLKAHFEPPQSHNPSAYNQRQSSRLVYFSIAEPQLRSYDFQESTSLFPYLKR